MTRKSSVSPKARRLVIRGGTLADGAGGPLREADVEVNGATITRVGEVPGGPGEEIDARGLLVTPGFVDIHTHYDGHFTWGEHILPSSQHGVTTVVAGNCGVGFAPCRETDREPLVRLMEGVEDIPQAVFADGLPWNWETFPQYLDALSTRRYDVDVAAYLPHAALRVYVMGERALRREPSTPTDRDVMRVLACEAMRAGAAGFSTSRIATHRSANGEHTPMYGSAAEELVAIAQGLGDAGSGLLQVVAGFADPVNDFALLRRLVEASSRPLSASLAQSHERPGTWREVLRLLEAAADDGLDITGQVYPRAIGMLMGLHLAVNPFFYHPTYRAMADAPHDERMRRLRDSVVRARLLAEVPETGSAADSRALRRAVDLEGIYALGDPPDYEPVRAHSIAALARAANRIPAEYAYDLQLEGEGTFTFFRPLHNYADGNLEACREMLLHPHCTLGLGDGGAHCGYICDAGYPSFLLSYWTRERTRGERIDLARAVKALSADAARRVGFVDRGVIAPGMKADLNIIDYDQLRPLAPRVAHDLPGGGRRLLQDARGFVATLVSGVVTQRDDAPTGALPGRLVRAGT